MNFDKYTNELKRKSEPGMYANTLASAYQRRISPSRWCHLLIEQPLRTIR